MRVWVAVGVASTPLVELSYIKITIKLISIVFIVLNLKPFICFFFFWLFFRVLELET